MSEFGIKVKNINAGMLYDVNLGTRDYFTYKEAMLNNSLFSFFLQKNGLNVYKKGTKNESTRDIICLDYEFGSRSYENEKERIEKLLKEATSDSEKEVLINVLEKVENNKELYYERNRDEIREFFYENGVDVTYKWKNKNGDIKKQETIHYEMLFRTSAKAKLGQVMFINSKLYDIAYDWLTIGLGKKMEHDNAKIVEMSAYAPLTTSTIVGTINIPVENILILKDQDSFFETMTKVVKAEEYIVEVKKKDEVTGKRVKIKEPRKKCVVVEEKREVKNTLWDGMALIEADQSYLALPDYINGMVLLRNHMFKTCAFKSYIQKFFKNWCKINGYDYETYQIQDMFGNWHYVKNIKMITTDNAIKWKKFSNLMGNTLSEAYDYWCDRIRADNNIWGIVKTDHPSKLGNYQQLSYQMINTLPCSSEDVKEIAQTTIDYIELLKVDNDEFEKFLRKNANEVNHYEMLADLYSQNKKFADSKFFRNEKKEIIKQYVFRMRKGKIIVNGDNLTVCGNPYALLLYSVGENYENDPTFSQESDAIQCYTERFEDGEYLAAFRNPHNSPNNICYLHNVYSKEMKEYFPFSKNIIAINCIHTDIQDRANGMDEDSDFMLVTNQKTMVKCAKRCYREFFTIVNALKESGITYSNTKKDYAAMDNKFSKSRMGIGYSSNLAQLAMTYYWTELKKDNPNMYKLKELYDNFIILSVLAQVIIDGCKREYEIDGNKEIDRISKLPSMKITKICGTTKNGKDKKIKYDFPEFMKYTREIKYTKDGKELPQEEISEKKDKLKSRINPELICPMNWLEDWLDKIQNASTSETVDTSKFFIKMKGETNRRQMTKIMRVIEEYDSSIKEAKIKNTMNNDEFAEFLKKENENVLNELSKIKIRNIVTINRLIELALGISSETGASKKRTYNPEKYTRKILNLLYKVDKDRFLANFICE
jgi:ribosome-binding protein aMBF1 (putative translation factor)